MNPEQDRLIRFDEVHRLTSLGRTTVWELEQKREFPARLRLGKQVVAWKLSEVIEFIETRQRVCDGA